jgi:hypothetical protein
MVSSRGIFVKKKYKFGFKSKNQLPLFMLWCEMWAAGELQHAYVIWRFG